MPNGDIDYHAARLTGDGWTVIPNAIGPAELGALRRAIDETLSAEEAIGRRLGTQTDDLRVVFDAHTKHPFFHGLLARNPLPLAVARHLLGADAYCHDLVIRLPMPTGRKDPTKFGGHLHVDWEAFNVTPFIGGRHYLMAIQCVWCVTEFTAQNGATFVWPGSQRSLQIPPRDSINLPPGWMRAEAPAGAVVMWDSALWHTSGVNHADAPRYSAVSYFQRGWIRGSCDPMHKWPPAIRAKLSDAEKRDWGLSVPPPDNTHIRTMPPEQLAALTPAEKAVLNIPAD